MTVRLAIITCLLLLAGNLLLGFVLMGNSRRAMKTLIDNRMLDIAKSAAGLLDGDALGALQAEDEGTEDYQKVNDSLKVFQDNIDLKYIYCVRPMEDGSFTFTVDPTVEDPGVFGDPVVATDALKQAGQGIDAVDKEPYTDHWGKFYSAYSPVFDSKGEVAGIVAVDFSAEWYDRQIAMQTSAILLCSLLSVTLGVIMMFLSARNLRTRASSMITALSADYRSVYYIDLDKDEGVCYQSHVELDNGLRPGEHFSYQKTLRKYADTYVTEKYREEFIRFCNPESIKKGLQNDKLIAFRYTVNRNGQESYEMMRMAGVRHPEDRADHIVHAVGMGFTDVDEETRRTLMQSQALSDALSVAESANKAKTTFLSTMSHEIRTPMNAIIGLDRLALEDETISDSTRESLEKIGASADHLLGIINDILDISRIEAGVMTLKKEEFSLHELIDQISIIIGGQCRDKKLTWICEAGEAQGYYLGDDVKLKQVLINILGNAVKFTPEGGSVTFRTERKNHFGKKSVFRFVIADTGIGMDPAFLPKLFDPFSQEDDTTKTKYGSTGLGMSITKSIVEMMNGDIKVGSEKGKGTTFTVTVTLEDSDTAHEKDEAKEVEAALENHVALEGKRVLLAEDVAINAEIMMMMLGQHRIDVDHAENGKIAVELFKSHPPGYYDAILMDLRMPEMDGLEATRIIRAMDREDAPEIPMIALTANAFDEDVKNSLQAGLNAHLSKPVDPKDLFATLEKLLS